MQTSAMTVAIEIQPGLRWPLRGGVPCLDFANSVAYRPSGRNLDALAEYGDLLGWGASAGFLTTDEAVRLRTMAGADPAGAAAAFAQAVKLREAIYRLFLSLARHEEIADVDFATLRTVLAEGSARAVLVREGEGFAFRGSPDEDDLALPLWKLAESAAALLTSGAWRRVRECPGHDCGWLFLDQTKNGNRRWCDSADCGNRARVRAHYRRRKSKDGSRMTGVRDS